MSGRKQIGVAEWNEEGARRFGPRARNWKFKCCMCGTVQSGQDFVDAGVSPDEALKRLGYSCIGRLTPAKGCDWTLGGLLQIHTLEVIDENGKAHPVFEFATEEEAVTP